MHTHSSAVELIEKNFSSLTDDLHDEIVEGLLHMQIGEFSRFAQRVIDTGDEKAWGQVTQVFMSLWSDCDAAVKNALNVSFLEHLNFTDQKRQRQWAFASMPVAMRRAWEYMDRYNRELHGG